MLKIITPLFLIVSLSSAETDLQLYTSAVIKLVQENKKINKIIKSNKNDIFIVKRRIKGIKGNKGSEPYLVSFSEKTEKEKQEINNINLFISKNI